MTDAQGRTLAGTVDGDRLVGEWTYSYTKGRAFTSLSWDLGTRGLPISLLDDAEAFVVAARRATSRKKRGAASHARVARRSRRIAK